jgi:hypothetical protein
VTLTVVLMVMKLVFEAKTQSRRNKNGKMAVIALGKPDPSYCKTLWSHGSRMRETEEEGRKRHELATMMNADGQCPVILAPFSIGDG